MCTHVCVVSFCTRICIRNTRALSTLFVFRRRPFNFLVETMVFCNCWKFKRCLNLLSLIRTNHNILIPLAKHRQSFLLIRSIEENCIIKNIILSSYFNICGRKWAIDSLKIPLNCIEPVITPHPCALCSICVVCTSFPLPEKSILSVLHVSTYIIMHYIIRKHNILLHSSLARLSCS